MAIHIRLTRKATGPWLYVILHVKDMTGRFAPNTPPGHILMLFYSRRLKHVEGTVRPRALQSKRRRTWILQPMFVLLLRHVKACKFSYLTKQRCNKGEFEMNSMTFPMSPS
ncbi:hypothetical protein Y1Q_0000133 [Alligator mississippiensis]|uniref:Uncharacterized protein n=1 Tax=Alligator mississippiensis TaxID=8496 RepID=A0A151MLR0_ALLMI|nr:hypothetical protein Y1Q_0000133 [Alligator mississippiensis]